MKATTWGPRHKNLPRLVALNILYMPWKIHFGSAKRRKVEYNCIITQSQKKCSMNSLASSATQGQVKHENLNRLLKTSKNIKQFSQYLEMSMGMLCFGICKTAQI